jgi:tetratricopeptide (TPR) repeat protein
MTREVPRLATLAAGLLTGLCVVVGACASPAVALAVEDGTVWQSELFGIQLELPEGWTVEEREYGGGSLHVVFTPPDGSPARLSLLVNPSSPPDPSEMQDAGVMAVEGTPGYDNARRVTRQIGEREAPGLEIDADQGEARYLLRQAYVVEHGTPFILQDFADVSVAERMRPVFDEAWDGIRFPPRSPEVEARAALEALAARCGSEVEFAATWEEAALRARKERKPVLVAARIYPGYSISDSRMSGPFMDRDVVALVNARTVPLLMDKGDPVPFADHDVYGLGPSTFGEAALLVSPEGEVLGESRVLGEDWLREALVLAPKLPGTPVPSDATGLDLAEAHYARGELDRAAALLADDESLDALLQRVRLHRRLERGAEALAELDRALQLPEAAAHEAELSLERGLVLAGLGRRDEALTQLDAAIEGLTPDAGPAHATRPSPATGASSTSTARRAGPGSPQPCSPARRGSWASASTRRGSRRRTRASSIRSSTTRSPSRRRRARARTRSPSCSPSSSRTAPGALRRNSAAILTARRTTSSWPSPRSPSRRCFRTGSSPRWPPRSHAPRTGCARPSMRPRTRSPSWTTRCGAAPTCSGASRISCARTPSGRASASRTTRRGRSAWWTT